MKKNIPRVAVALKPSRRLARFLSGATLATLLLWGALFAYLPPVVFISGVVAVLLSAARAWFVTMKCPCRSIALAEDGFCELTFARIGKNGPGSGPGSESVEVFEGNVVAGTLTHAWLVSLTVKDNKKSRAILVLPDMMTPDEWRQFRVMAKSARSENAPS